MKTLTIINWGLVIFYLVLITFFIYEFLTVGTDKAGEGLAVMYLIFFATFVGILFVLNLFSHQWLKILTLVVGLAPILYTLNNNANRYVTKKRKANRSYYFKTKPMQDMLMAIQDKDLVRVQELLPTVLPTINQIGNTGSTLLHFAVTYQGKPIDTQIVEFLLANGADPNAHLDNTQPVLANAVSSESLKVVQLLLDHGANPNAKTYDHIPILAHALNQYNTPHKKKKIVLLLQHGADPNVVFKRVGGSDTLTSIMLAANNKEWDICLLLLDAGADPNFESSATSGYMSSFRNMLEHQKAWYPDGKLPVKLRELLAHDALKKEL